MVSWMAPYLENLAKVAQEQPQLQGYNKLRNVLFSLQMSKVQSETQTFLDLYSNAPIKVTPNNATELKFTLDDALKSIFTTDYKFSQDFAHVDRKLLLGKLF